ncbi:MAG: Uma2 family endonuclease [Candidatus Competibacteraceae bacterium]|nr:Uma2 family endonuclease [Candidatus Competibacteraceae bacterium]MCP5127899.1 Uma2 family endonuclease [Gammaproteobacteria bacterium]HRX70935.1 Uma2 family endonuclease [Candidatus Competibacteraceae bacterium]
MLPKLQHRLTAEEYLFQERLSATRREYLDGEIFAMAGASRRHNQISSNLTRILGNQLANRPCSVYSSDMKVKIEKLNKYAYPDVLIVCGQQQFEDENEDVLLNPLLIMEVLSDSTEAYDRGDKFLHYQGIPSLAEYLLVSQKSCRIEQFTRQSDDTWVYSQSDEINDEVGLKSVDCSLKLQDVYAKVEV